MESPAELCYTSDEPDSSVGAAARHLLHIFSCERAAPGLEAEGHRGSVRRSAATDSHRLPVNSWQHLKNSKKYSKLNKINETLSGLNAKCNTRAIRAERVDLGVAACDIQLSVVIRSNGASICERIVCEGQMEPAALQQVASDQVVATYYVRAGSGRVRRQNVGDVVRGDTVERHPPESELRIHVSGSRVAVRHDRGPGHVVEHCGPFAP